MGLKNEFIKETVLINPTRFFLWAASIFWVLYTLVTPPLQSPDELSHFYRAYQVSEGHFAPEKENNRLGGKMPYCFKEFILPYGNASGNEYFTLTQHDLLRSFEIPFSGTKKEFEDFPNTAYYSPVSYMPQAISIFIFRQFNCSVATLYYGGRLFTFLFWLLCMLFVLRTLPGYQWLFTLLMLLPMHVYISNSYSADIVTNCLSFMFVALVFKTISSKKKVGKKLFCLFACIALLLALAKLVYVGLVFLLWLIPLNKFKSKTQRALPLLFILIISFTAAYLWSAFVMHYYTPYSEYNAEYRDGIWAMLVRDANYGLQKEHLLSHPLHFFTVLLNSILHARLYLTSYIGGFGAFLDMFLPDWLYVISYMTIAYTVLFEERKINLSVNQKLIVFVSVIFTFALLLLSQHLTWNVVGNDIIDFVQGRYLIPLFPLLFMLLSNGRIKVKLRVDVLVIIYSIFINLYTCKLLYDRFFKESFYEKTEFFCGAEEKNTDGNFLTSNPRITLQGGQGQSSKVKRTGNYATVLSSGSPFGFIYAFKNLGHRDLIEIEVWQKGEGGVIVVSGKGQECSDFYFPNNHLYYQDKQAWWRMNAVFSVRENCKNSEVSFYVYNPGKETIYFDDLKFSVKKFHSK